MPTLYIWALTVALRTTIRRDIVALQKLRKNPQSLVKKADFNTNLTISSSFESLLDRS